LQEGASGFGDTSSKVKQSIDTFYEYKKNEKPSKKGDLTSLEGSLAKIHSSQRPNGRDEFEPEAGIVPTSLVEQWTGMEKSENVYEVALRKSYTHFLTLEALSKKFNQKHGKSMAWLTNQKAVFDSGMHGSSAIECEGLLDNLVVVSEHMLLQEKAAEDLLGILNYDRYHEKADPISAPSCSVMICFCTTQSTYHTTAQHARNPNNINVLLRSG
jgi:hypothetical protein